MRTVSVGTFRSNSGIGFFMGSPRVCYALNRLKYGKYKVTPLLD